MDSVFDEDSGFNYQITTADGEKYILEPEVTHAEDAALDVSGIYAELTVYSHPLADGSFQVKEAVIYR